MSLISWQIGGVGVTERMLDEKLENLIPDLVLLPGFVFCSH